MGARARRRQRFPSTRRTSEGSSQYCQYCPRPSRAAARPSCSSRYRRRLCCCSRCSPRGTTRRAWRRRRRRRAHSLRPRPGRTRRRRRSPRRGRSSPRTRSSPRGTGACAMPVWTPTSEFRPRFTGVEGTRRHGRHARPLKASTACASLRAARSAARSGKAGRRCRRTAVAFAVGAVACSKESAPQRQSGPGSQQLAHV